MLCSRFQSKIHRRTISGCGSGTSLLFVFIVYRKLLSGLRTAGLSKRRKIPANLKKAIKDE